MAGKKCEHNVQGHGERPQGFEEGKLAKRGKVKCFYGCGMCFGSVIEALTYPHECQGKKTLREDVINMYTAEKLDPPKRYTRELTGEAETDDSSIGIGVNGPNTSRSTTASESSEDSGFVFYYKDVQKAFRTDKQHVKQWLKKC